MVKSRNLEGGRGEGLEVVVGVLGGVGWGGKKRPRGVLAWKRLVHILVLPSRLPEELVSDGWPNSARLLLHRRGLARLGTHSPGQECEGEAPGRPRATR
jgi:hypothetical protein